MNELAAFGSGERGEDEARRCVTQEEHPDDQWRDDDDGPDAASAPDDSADDECQKGSEIASSSDGEGSSAEDDVLWADPDTEQAVNTLIEGDGCDAMCVSGKQKGLQDFILSMARLTKHERRVSLLTTLSVLKEADVADRRRGSGLRERFSYYLPMVGRVCRPVFCKAYGVAPVTIKRLRQQIKDGSFSPAEHGGLKNKKATSID
ncbi:hypothetical protein BBJ28_00027100, partial [Nothophytophthora sp. Chile5]